ncbi:hypothetical protein B0A48_10577 [Cryoendolithus antarcticus]|uniref:SET domain-containing protein n=1 Tax=Cryoendolithus antarcticus TaxID=1507870 RepID=A0A1V8SXP8_9PEZI|nr:hypothetical protein B0A48_10577 [Cryoendolithus antarcticus]
MDAAATLESWFRKQPGAYLHPDVRISYSPEAGGHWRANAAVEPGTRLVVVPHSLAFSHLNALVDDAYPVFKQQRVALGVEITGFFYLMLQYLHHESSFWKHYLEALPKPEDQHTTPLWFDNADDESWLADTDAAYTAQKRREAYLGQYDTGVTVLRKAGIDTSSLTWDLFRWAVTMYTSRSFSSRSIAPQDSKYWAAYKSGTGDSRQAVLLDLSHASADDRNFSVLFPVIDSANHTVDSKVDWTFDPGRFSLATVDSIQASVEVNNNYGPKGNDELLLGYGFCIPNNPNDTVMLTLKPPSEELQTHLRSSHAGYFDASKQWDGEKATFKLRRLPSQFERAEDVFNELPVPLLELLTLIIRSERGLPFQTVPDTLGYLLQPDSPSRQYLPFIARMIVTSLAPKLQRLQAQTLRLTARPQNVKQAQAKIYRDGQIEIITTTMHALRGFLRSLRPAHKASRDANGQAGGKLLLLDDVVSQNGPMERATHSSDISRHTDPVSSGGNILTLDEILFVSGLPRSVLQEFLAGIEANANTSNVTELRHAGWEEDVWVLFLSYMWLSSSGNPATSLAWMEALAAEYSPATTIEDASPQANNAEDQDSSDLMSVVRQAVGSRGGDGNNVWEDERWSEGFIAGFGGKVLQHHGFAMMVTNEDGEEEQRLVVYLHGA